ncbi:MAG: DUF2330 domain-containing protein [Myxococcota bacterium]
MLPLALSLASPAAACGGLFCDPYGSGPIDQSGEIVVFDVDQQDQMVEVDVRISYEGAAHDFAWILPVPGVPQLFRSTNALFESLDAATALNAELAREEFNCGRGFSDTDTDSDADSDTDADVDIDTPGTGVDVVDVGQVGPYETVVLTATSPDALTTWLDAKGYALPVNFSEAVTPYVAPGMHFVALRLSSEAEVGDIEPIGVRYPGTVPIIPLRLTSVAATEDMPVDVILLGSSRAVPTNYLHVRLNPIVYPWWGGPGFPDRIARAVDEAGGHAFVTTFAGTPYVRPVYDERQYDPDALAERADPAAFVSMAAGYGYSLEDPAAIAALVPFLPPPYGMDAGRFYGCPQCYPAEYAELAETFDPVGAAAALDGAVAEPLRRAQSVLDANPVVTRLRTAVSPHEMTVDPTFAFNQDLPMVPLRRMATLRLSCGPDQSREDGIYQLETRGHPPVMMPPSSFANPEEWLADRTDHFAMVVEQLSDAGPGEVLADFTEEIDWSMHPPTGRVTEGTRILRGCGCDAGHGAAAALPLLPVAWLLRRRRTRRSR